MSSKADKRKKAYEERERRRQENRDKQEKIRGAGTLEELAKAMGVKLR